MDLVNKSLDSFFFKQSAQEKQSPIGAKAAFFQNSIEEKATGKNKAYYEAMEKAMKNNKVYELHGVRARYYRKAMDKANGMTTVTTQCALSPSHTVSKRLKAHLCRNVVIPFAERLFRKRKFKFKTT